jgi:glycosyltransferase involved in cell wall biosynthesis
MPVAEALACGIPVVTSNVSSLPEAGAGLALTVDPHDVEALALALQQALSDTALQEKCRVLAPSVREQFSAENMVKQTITVYEQAVASHAVPQNISVNESESSLFRSGKEPDRFFSHQNGKE